ncbi:MAG TPA: peptide deformylase [Candidatus Saccharibacteria bacterium]|jgi:peptide deformylase|nr:peptide deformylase [Candidatus Saccharibacteria bacterium]HMT55729.1 peptide deformylase [Candidatus Saccharibacteria bacterium]
MSRKLIVLPQEELRKRSIRVGFVDESIKAIIKDMENATLAWEDSREHEVGVALAAVQINVHKRIVIVRNNFDNKADRTFQVFINPEIVKYDGDIIEDYEGCLSVKDIYGKVPRYNRVKVKAKDAQGKDVRITAEGFLARVFQHEIDHTNGMLFVDRIKDNPKAFYKLADDGTIKDLSDEERTAYFRILW